uniref:COMM domain-containing protein n=1 Tax=Palpitomonas bilix TaxID=652834 RepID=A0A7S3GGQ4_9EUKA|mmetsp:Transcript_48590/g.126075  ORF Transcript_48590/g.126075 Transcript_48590/m.126075 type:complete len:206 (+) Transcript_48590:171-788(+)|eukprot:CAMPEP_0113918492 /NCGR_PEP_ID=MMETSP0780_2-20120614/33388_1 /TAXON_ID=652834 /ORGANISM="Palpitomonas bilix" /LENGTH=205 /DNA_ID=CAMNT_0000918319 /DNA_START=141 /DNA_END=758 /DNA_ORIENTATION=- /assembly_acc=CAM_ASM_000599
MAATGDKLFFAGQDGVDSNVLADLGQLASLTPDQAEQISTVAFSALKGMHTKDAVLGLLDKFCEAHGMKRAGLERLFRSLLFFFQVCAQKHLSPPLLRQDLNKLGVEDEVALVVVEKYRNEFADVSRSLVERTLNVNQLKNLKWKFGVTSSNSEMASVGKTFLQLSFTIQNGEKKEEKLMELSLPQFYTLLQEMEKAKAALDYFS